MAKLKKQGQMQNSGTIKSTKSIPVEDKDGNQHILKATVISVPTRKNVSNAIQEDDLEQIVLSNKIVKPPLSQHELSVLQEVSSELGQVLESLSVGIDGFGSRWVRRKPDKEVKISDDQQKILDAEALEEKAWLDSIMAFPNPDEDFSELKKKTRVQLEATGNAYWELVPMRVGDPKKRIRYSCINRLDPATMLISKPDRKITRVKFRYVDGRCQTRERIFNKRMRLFLQRVGTKSVWFKEFGDPRVIHKKTGEVCAPNEAAWEHSKKLQKKCPKKMWANEVFHHEIFTPRRTPYGMPRHTGNIIAIKGSRGADETNILTQQNNHVPSMAITVAGGQLTEGSIQRIREFVDTQIKGNMNYSKFLILEGESTHDSLSGAGNLKIEIKPLSQNQHQDQLWQSYDENNASKIRRSHRTPPIMVGKTEDLNRNNAQESERLSEKWVYNPARESMDKAINRIFMQQGFKHWNFKSNSPNVTNDQDLVKILTGAEKTGGLTPRISRMLLEDILNRELPPVKEGDPDFDPDVPFSLSIARLSMRPQASAANAAGTFSPQGQNARPRGEDNRSKVLDKLIMEVFTDDDGENILNNFIKSPEGKFEIMQELRDRIEDTLDLDSFGEVKRDYFDHEH